MVSVHYAVRYVADTDFDGTKDHFDSVMCSAPNSVPMLQRTEGSIYAIHAKITKAATAPCQRDPRADFEGPILTSQVALLLVDIICLNLLAPSKQVIWDGRNYSKE